MSGDIHYAQTDGTHIAFSTVGEGTRDVLVVMDGFVPIDAIADEPRLARCTSRLSSLGRLIRFDRRGIGLSDPVSPTAPPTLEQWVEDAIAVLDAARSERAVVVAAAEASPVGLLLAAMHPDRIHSVVVVNAYARALADWDYPDGVSPAEATASLEATTSVEGTNAEDDFVFVAAPSAARDPIFREWWRQTGRRGASPATAKALLRVALESDVRSALPLVQAPTLVIHLRDEPLIPMTLGRYVADHVSGAQWLELDGADDFWWASDSAGLVLDEIEEFVTGVRAVPTAARVLATILFTDIVSSTALAATLGDQRWRELLDTFDRAVRRQLARFRGTEVNTTGDGFVVTFDGPARAVGCAAALRDAARQVGLEVRSGVHTGEIELRGQDIAGIGVHIAARIAALAQPSSIYVSRTVTDLVVGSGLLFDAVGEHELKGVPGTWAVWALSDN
ncbi:MAG: family 3 adenylate cyclase [Aeromicrobium sp.]|nr:family 3 adenylate cyclase [Aeromicrobium sp.]